MPGLSGSQPALMEARAGIARFGATRIGYFAPSPFVVVTGSHDRHAYTLIDALRMSLSLNGPSTAYVRFKPGTSALEAIAVKDVVEIAFDLSPGGATATTTQIFAGQVDRVRMIRRQGNLGDPFVEIDAMDWTRQFDRKLVTRTWTNTSITDIAVDVVEDYTSGFTTRGVQLNLPTLASFAVANARPSEVLRQLVQHLGGGGWRIAIDRDIRLFDGNGDVVADGPTPPLSLTNTRNTLRAFAHSYDGTQVRNRTLIEGRSQSVLIDAPVGAPSVPLSYGWGFIPSGGVSNAGYVRWSGSVSHVEPYYSCSHILGPPARVVATEAQPGDTEIELTETAVDSYFFQSAAAGGSTTWAHDSGGNLFRYTGAITGPPHTLVGIPASGYGAITETIPAGTVIYGQDAITFIGGTTIALTAGDTATMRVSVEDTAEQLLTQVKEVWGTDGVHEHLITSPWQASPYGEELTPIAQADLTAFKSTAGLLSAEWVTTDMNAVPGAVQPIALTGTDALTASVVITQVDLRWEKDGSPPVRRCQGGDLALQSYADLLLEGLPG